MIRGEVYWADFGIPFGREPGYRRPVLVLQSNVFNESKIRTTIVVPFTTNLAMQEAPGNVFMKKEETRLTKDSVIVVSQITVMDKKRLVERVATVKSEKIEAIEEGIKLVLGFV